MFVPHKDLNFRHMTMAFCRRVAERKQRRLAEEEERAGANTEFTAYGIPLSLFTFFKCLGWIIMASDNEWKAIVGNLRKARRNWARLKRVMVREGVGDRTLVHIYLSVVQLVMLYWSETWVMTSCIGGVLGVFHHRVVLSLTGRQPR